MIDNLLIRALVLFAIFTIAFIFASYVRNLISRKDLSKMPTLDQKIQIFKQIFELKNHGAGYQECLKYLTSNGIRKGVARNLLIEFEKANQSNSL